MTDKTISKAAQKRQDIADAVAALRDTYPKGSEVPTIVRHVSSSGTSRDISTMVVSRETFEVLNTSYRVALVLGRPLSERNGGMAVVCRGAGMDIAFDLVYSLAQALYGDGYALSYRRI